MLDVTSIVAKNIVAENDKREHEKKSFWASDCERNAFDLYHAWIGTPPTNPFDAKSLWRFACGKAAEECILAQIKDELAEDGDQYRIEFEWEGVPITGYADAKLKDGTIVEIKSYYGEYQAKDMLAGAPKLSYLKQLAVYMYAEKLKKGLLYMVPMPMGEHFQFVLEQTSEGVFECNGVTFDIVDEFVRWKKLYEDNIKPKIEPVSEYRYKYDLDTLDWRSISKSQISQARNGHKVLGDWQILYSPYKDLIVEKEGTDLGYTLQELALIKEKTTGYTNWR